MIEVFFHNLTSNTNESKLLHSLPRKGDTIAFAPSKSFYLVTGVTQNSFSSSEHLKEQYEYEVYATEINQSEWIGSLR